MRGGCYTTEFGRGSGRGGVGAGKGGSWMALHLDGLDRVAFMVYFWFGWNNRMGVSGGRVDAVLGREQDRTGTGTGSWDLEYREKLVGVRGKSLLHNSSLHSFSFFPSFPLGNLDVGWNLRVSGLFSSIVAGHRTTNSTASAVCPAPAPSTDFRGPNPQHGTNGINTNLEAEENGTM